MKKNILSVIALILALVSLALCGMTISAAWDMADRYDAQLAWMDERYASLESRLDALEARPETPAPTEPVYTEEPDEDLTYCNLIIDDWTFENGVLTVHTAFAQVMAENNSLESAFIELKTEDAPVILTIEMLPGEASDSYELDLYNLVYELPELYEGEWLSLNLHVTLADGTTLVTSGGTWEYLEGKLHMSVG
ncbi:MAG: hypothetical protein IKJ99_07195 [Oscillospiraceae bacterium]|nr:hypothetical protein [Oscillospiraceae bacterium]